MARYRDSKNRWLLIGDMTDTGMPVEVRSLAGTLKRWRAQILAWTPPA